VEIRPDASEHKKVTKSSRILMVYAMSAIAMLAEAGNVIFDYTYSGVNDAT
jgi:hypothetical protein